MSDRQPTATAEGYASLAELQAVHAELLKTVPDENPTPEHVETIDEFLRRGAATGVVLDAPADRKQAQGLLEYWTAALYTTARPQSRLRDKSSQRGGLVLAPFNDATVVDVARRADAALADMSEADRDLAESVLMRTLRLPPGGHKPEPRAVARAQLDGLADPDRVRHVLTKLEAADVVRIDGDRVELRYEALTRTWAPLGDAVKRRVAFREAVEYWTTHDESAVALIGGKPLDEARKYGDHSPSELRFIDASRNRERRNWHLMRGFAVGATCAAVLLGYLWRHARRETKRADFEAGLALASQTEAVEARKKAEEFGVAMRTRFELSNLLQVTRALTEVATAQSPADRQVAIHRWKSLSAAVRTYDKTMPPPPGSFNLTIEVLDKFQADIAKVTAEKGRITDLNMLTKTVLTVARDARNSAIKLEDPAVNDWFKVNKQVVYQQVKFCVDDIVTSLEKRPFADAVPLVREFWSLYFGDMVLLEGEVVEKNMIAFGDQLRLIQKGVSDVWSKELDGVCGTRGADNSEVAWLWASVPLGEAVQKGVKADDLGRISAAFTKDATQAQVEKLKGLVPPLKAALDTELGGNPIANVNKPTATY